MQLDLSRFSPAERSTLQLRVLYEGAGYRKFRCSHFEEYSLYQQNERFLSDSQVITFTDLDGKLRAIKPDVTLSIAKNAQPAAGECKKYYYTEQICRPSRESHTFSEISQMGLECIGAVGAAEQAEVVRLALESLASLEVPTVLEVSHMGFVTALLDTLHVDAAARPRLLELLRDKNAHELHAAALQSGLDEAAANALTAILSLHGPFGTTLAAARSQCQCEAQQDALLELQSLQNELGDAGRGMQLDLSLAGDMEYYNGLVFSGYVAGVPRAVLKGGRHDLLAIATEDKLHQPYRMPLMPGSKEVFDMARLCGAKAVYVSGAGSTVMAVAEKAEAEKFYSKLEKGLELLEGLDGCEAFTLLRLDADNTGATVE